MGSTDFSEMKYRVKLRAGQRDDLAAVTTGTGTRDYYGIWVNMALQQLCTQDRILGIPRKLYFPELETNDTATTTASVAYVDMPTDCLFIRRVFDNTNRTKLDWISFRTYVEYADRTTATGKPREWLRRDTHQYFHPTPAGAYVIARYYKKIHPELTGTDTTIIGPEWDEVIVSMAAQKMHLWLAEYDKAKVVENEIIALVSGLVGVYDNEELDRGEYMRPDYPYWVANRGR